MTFVPRATWQGSVFGGRDWAVMSFTLGLRIAVVVPAAVGVRSRVRQRAEGRASRKNSTLSPMLRNE